MVRRLEAIGAAVESERTGEAFFALDGLRGIHGGDSAGVLAAARQGGRRSRSRIGVAPTRLRRLRRRLEDREAIVPPAALRPFLAPLRVSILPLRLDPPAGEAEELVETLGGWGSRRWEPWRRSRPTRSPTASARSACEALRLARGEDDAAAPARARTRSWPSRSSCRRGPRAASSTAPWSCWSTACSPRRSAAAAPLLGLRLGALLAAGGSWSVEQGLGRPTASARVLRSVLAPRLEALPGPATALRLRAVGLGPPAADQLELAVGGEEPRRRRLGEAVREVRAAQGAEALLEGPPGRPRLARPRALGDADALPGAVGGRDDSRPAAALRPAAGEGRGRSAGGPARSTASRWRRCARSGWSRTAGGRRSRCGGTTSSWRWPTGATVVVFRCDVSGRWYRQRA